MDVMFGLVSIHAPAWGATPGRLMSPPGATCFNPRSRVGSDGVLDQMSKCIIGFNPRSRVGSDIEQAVAKLGQLGFNPRSRVGSDMAIVRREMAAVWFQSTLPRGERPVLDMIIPW